MASPTSSEYSAIYGTSSAPSVNFNNASVNQMLGINNQYSLTAAVTTGTGLTLTCGSGGNWGGYGYDPSAMPDPHPLPIPNKLLLLCL